MEFNGNRYIGDIALKRRPEGGSYLNDIPAVKYLMEAGHIELRSPVTFFIGENGAGKSTLLEAIAVTAGFNPEGGTRNFNFSTRNTHSELCGCISLTRYGYPKDGFFLRAESFYNVASNIDELDEAGGIGPQLKDSYGGKSLHAQSHGESFISLMQNRFGGRGLYLLDEPEAALSPQRQMSLLVEIARCAAQGSQFIIASHSPILLAMPEAEILCFDADGVRPCTYEETDSYRITKMFLDDRKRILHHLIDGIE